jgi:protease-4
VDREPGNAAVEAERIYRAIESLKKKHDRPVIAIINNVGASVAYMIAMHTDRVYCAYVLSRCPWNQIS